MPPAASVVGILPTAPTEPHALSQIRNETIFALIESPSDKHQRHARRYSTNVSRMHTAIRQKSAAHTPLFNKCQRHTHRYLTNVSGIHRYSTKFSGILTAIRQMSAVYTPLFDKVDVHSYIHTTRACVHIFAAPIPNKFASIRTTTLRHLYNSKTPQFESTSKSDMRVPLRIRCCAACRPTRASANKSPSIDFFP